MSPAHFIETPGTALGTTETTWVSSIPGNGVADADARRWKKKGAWRGAYFPKFNVTVAYHRPALLAKYQWGHDKFPNDTPFVFYHAGQQILPSLGLFDGFKVVLENMVSYIQKEVPGKTFKFWRLQSQRHFYGSEWNQNGSCLFSEALNENELDLWFDPSKNGVNKEARQIDHAIELTLKCTDIHSLGLTHLSDYRAHAHPSIWFGKKDANGNLGSELHALVPTWCS
ncbi:hypothetical protein GH714_029872 [Hevea brasiliensis]|uniref:Trichome birefringence-like C-terminal domain-containing protein n=1 Tax=Hevea brasiliensis TaxID=3981 RepID=A0A6A6N399_HEVBR|nr:hypothetical protein GH714_029872 [Hevea brasiliensis]